MEPLESDGAWTRELLALAAEARAQHAESLLPGESMPRAQFSALRRVRNQLRQAVAALEAAVEASRRVS